MRYSNIAALTTPLIGNLWLCSSEAETAAPTTPTSYKIEQNDKLLMVQVVFRHGARTPLTSRHDFWKDQTWSCCGDAPYGPQPQIHLMNKAGEASPPHAHNLKQMSRKLEGGCFQGQLTTVGHQQANDLGKMLRHRYVQDLKFLDVSYIEDQVKARTTNFQRTINTLQGVLTGLWPDLPLSKTTVPILTSGETDEILYADTKTCPHLGTFLEASKALIRSQLRGDSELGRLAARTKKEVKRILNLNEEYFDRSWAWSDVHDAMTSMRAHNKTIPQELHDKPWILEAVNKLATREFSAFVAPSIQDEHGKAILRLSMGVLLHTLIENIHEKISEKVKGGKSGPKFFLFSGHDSSVMPVLAALGVEIETWPPYCSNVVIELWERPDGQHLVRCLFNGEEVQIPHVANGTQPTLSTFKTEVLGPFLLSQDKWGAACQVKVSHDSSLPQPISVMDDDE